MTTTIDRTRQAGGSVGLLQGSALYIASVLGTGILVLPALAAELAGPASIVAVAAVLLLSIPLAGTFAALAARHPDAGGVATFVRLADGFTRTGTSPDHGRRCALRHPTNARSGPRGDCWPCELSHPLGRSSEAGHGDARVPSSRR